MSLKELKIIVLKKMSYEKTYKDNSMKFTKSWEKYLIEMNLLEKIKILWKPKSLELKDSMNQVKYAINNSCNRGEQMVKNKEIRK